MRTSAVLLAAVAMLGCPNAFGGGFDVTRNQLVQADLAAAESYWQRPAPCVALSVIVKPMVAGQGNDGAGVQAAQAWAETPIYGCEIDLSPGAWAQAFDPRFPSMWCVGPLLIRHEYAHSIGLPDTAGGGIMDSDGFLSRVMVSGCPVLRRQVHRRQAHRHTAR